jgi:hypothetical protein
MGSEHSTECRSCIWGYPHSNISGVDFVLAQRLFQQANGKLIRSSFIINFLDSFMLLSGFNFIVVPPIYFLIEHEGGVFDSDGVVPGYGLLLIELSGLGQISCYFLTRHYSKKLQDALFIEELIEDSDDEEEREIEQRSISIND